MGRMADWATKTADRIDQFAFKTEAASKARAKFDDPDFAEFLSASAREGSIDVEKMRAGADERKLGSMYERYEKRNTTIERAKQILHERIERQMGVSLDESDLKSVEEYLKRASVEDVKTFERMAATLERGAALDKEVAQRRDRLETLKDSFGRERLKLADMRSHGGIFGNTETRAWAHEEARRRGYGPVQTFMFRTFSANSAIEEKIAEGSGLSKEALEKVYASVTSAEKGIEKIEGKVRETVIANLLKETGFANEALKHADQVVLTRVAQALQTPESFSVQELVAERERFEKFLASDFAPKEYQMIQSSIDELSEKTFGEVLENLEQVIEHRVDSSFENFVKEFAADAISPTFTSLREEAYEMVSALSDGTPAGDRSARMKIVERLRARDLSALPNTKRMLVSILINDLAR